MANKDQKSRSASNKPKLSMKEKKEPQGAKSGCEARPLAHCDPEHFPCPVVAPTISRPAQH